MICHGDTELRSKLLHECLTGVRLVIRVPFSKKEQ